jgi:phage head maturation protease
MSNIEKFLKDGHKANNLNVPIDIQKDSDHQRIVVGFATLDNVDLTGDVITAEASMNAFTNFRGNVRMQHDKLRPVGKVVDFAPATFFDPKTNKEYQGVQVAVAISEAADDVWKMCLDGTLSGFSVGGKVHSQAPEYREDIDQTVQVIKDYQLTELSLVDSPANHLANVQTIYKSIDGNQEESGIHMYGEIQKVLEINSKGDNPQMANENEPEKTTEAAPIDEVVTESPVVDATETPKAEEAAATEETKKPTLEEVIQNLSAQIEGQAKEVSESVSKSLGESLALQIDDVKKEFDSRFSTLQEDAKKSIDGPIAALAEKIEAIEKSLETTEKSLNAITANSAMQKSLETESVETKIEPTDENPFAGVFSSRYE